MLILVDVSIKRGTHFFSVCSLSLSAWPISVMTTGSYFDSEALCGCPYCWLGCLNNEYLWDRLMALRIHTMSSPLIWSVISLWTAGNAHSGSRIDRFQWFQSPYVSVNTLRIPNDDRLPQFRRCRSHKSVERISLSSSSVWFQTSALIHFVFTLWWTLCIHKLHVLDRTGHRRLAFGSTMSVCSFVSLSLSIFVCDDTHSFPTD